MEKKVLKFWTGRGGRFNNAGHVYYRGFENIDQGTTFDDLFFNEDNNKWFQPDGNHADFEINGDGTGYLNIDHDYDMTNCVMEDDLNTKQVWAVIDELNKLSSKDEELVRIITDYYPDFLDQLKDQT